MHQEGGIPPIAPFAIVPVAKESFCQELEPQRSVMLVLRPTHDRLPGPWSWLWSPCSTNLSQRALTAALTHAFTPSMARRWGIWCPAIDRPHRQTTPAPAATPVEVQPSSPGPRQQARREPGSRQLPQLPRLPACVAWRQEAHQPFD
jgi:hypothetical protein